MFRSFKRTDYSFHFLYQIPLLFRFANFTYRTIIRHLSRIGLETWDIVVYLRNECVRNIFTLGCLILDSLIIYGYFSFLLLVLKIVSIVFWSRQVKWLLFISPPLHLLLFSHSALKLLSIASKRHCFLVIFQIIVNIMRISLSLFLW